MNGQKAGLLKQSIELIETLWNVNQKWSIYDVVQSLELIETLWNVNLLENTEITETEKN